VGNKGEIRLLGGVAADHDKLGAVTEEASSLARKTAHHPTSSGRAPRFEWCLIDQRL
jgi:hypothetical protein